MPTMAAAATGELPSLCEEGGSNESTRIPIRGGTRYYFGVYFAVLPAHPSISPSLLLDACHKVAAQIVGASASAEADADSDNKKNSIVEWRQHRVARLVHPQLTEPLEFLEISGNVQDEEVCQVILEKLLLESSAVVGNAELLLVLPETPIPILPCDLPLHEFDGGSGSGSSGSRCKQAFDEYGLVGLSGAVVGIDMLQELFDYTLDKFQQLSQAMNNNSNSNPNKKHFKEIMQRDEHRFDFRLDTTTTTTTLMGAADLEEDNNNNKDSRSRPKIIWEQLEAQSSWIGLVREILGDDYVRVKCGCVLSLPGAGEQYWHSDGVHITTTTTTTTSTTADVDLFDSEYEAAPTYALCVFVPLIDLTMDTGYTEFWAGSHRFSKLLSKKGEQSLPGGTLGLVRKGDCLLYDYRTIHRGMSNTSHAPRPVCYYLYAKAGYENVEDQNFTAESVWD